MNALTSIFSRGASTLSEYFKTPLRPSTTKQPINIEKLKGEWEKIKSQNDPVKEAAFYAKLNVKISKHQSKFLQDARSKRTDSLGNSILSDGQQKREMLDKRSVALNEARRFELTVKNQMAKIDTKPYFITPKLAYGVPNTDHLYTKLREFETNNNVNLRMEKVTIDGSKILTFGLSKRELTALAMTNKEFAQIIPKSIIERSFDELEEQPDTLQKDADHFFSALGDNRINFDPPPLDAKGNISDVQLIKHYLGDLQTEGLVVGESHSDTSPKDFLIRNMEELKKNGVSTIFLEHVFIDTMQEELDNYLKGPPDAKFPVALEGHLKVHEFLQRAGTGIKPSEYEGNTLKDVIIAAKKAGIRVVGLDTVTSYQSGTSEKFGVTDASARLKGMNFVANEIVQNEKGKGKYVILCGLDHACTNSGDKVAGLNEILGVPTIAILDKNKKIGIAKKNTTQSNVDIKVGQNSDHTYRNVATMIVKDAPKGHR